MLDTKVEALLNQVCIPHSNRHTNLSFVHSTMPSTPRLFISLQPLPVSLGTSLTVCVGCQPTSLQELILEIKADPIPPALATPRVEEAD